MGKADGNAAIFYEWPGSLTDRGSCAAAENTVRRMALNLKGAQSTPELHLFHFTFDCLFCYIRENPNMECAQ